MNDFVHTEIVQVKKFKRCPTPSDNANFYSKIKLNK